MTLAEMGAPLVAARDLSPRIFTYFVYGSEVFTSGGHYWVRLPLSRVKRALS